MWSLAIVLLCMSFGTGADDIQEIDIVITDEGHCEYNVPPRIILNKELRVSLHSMISLRTANCLSRFHRINLAHYRLPNMQSDYGGSRLLTATMDMNNPWTCTFEVSSYDSYALPLISCTFMPNMVEDSGRQRFWVVAGVVCVVVCCLGLIALGTAVRYMLLIQSREIGSESAADGVKACRDIDSKYESIRGPKLSLAEHIYEIPEVPSHSEFDISIRPQYPTPLKTNEVNQPCHHYETPYARL